MAAPPHNRLAPAGLAWQAITRTARHAPALMPMLRHQQSPQDRPRLCITRVQAVIGLTHSPMAISFFLITLMLNFWWQLLAALASVGTVGRRPPTLSCLSAMSLAHTRRIMSCRMGQQLWVE
jgi:hypothetical protein